MNGKSDTVKALCRADTVWLLMTARFIQGLRLLLSQGLAFSKHSAVIAAFGQHFAKTKRVPPQFYRYLIAERLLGPIGSDA